MADARRSERSTAAGLRGPQQRLRAGETYFDLNDPERGPFVATGEEEVPPGSNIVAREDMGDDAWARLLADGFGEAEFGAGDRAYDQGAYGQEDDPRSDVLNAAPPGVGEGLTPHETTEELPRKQGGERGSEKRKHGS